jgi:hypothetical protein
METIKKAKLDAIQNIKDVICALMLGKWAFDIETIQHCTDIEMQETGLRFRPYFTVLAENIEGYKQTPFDETSDYFFDAINCQNITEGKIGLLVELCIN